jgi:ribosomal protein S9
MSGVVKVRTVNLEANRPTAEEALRIMESELTACRRRGVRAVILIHGYGSSGVGGAIRTAVRRRLAESGLRGVVRMSAGGEEWSPRKGLLAALGALAAYERSIAGKRGSGGRAAVIRRCLLRNRSML